VASDVPTIDILGIRLARLTAEAALERVVTLYERAKPALVFHANAHTLNSAVIDPAYAEVLASADLVLNDGKGTMLAARILRQRFLADLNGNFFAPLVLKEAARRKWPVFFLGARPGIAARAADELVRTIDGLHVVGVHDGYFSPANEDDVIAGIRESGAGLLLVGMGNPQQEIWLNRSLDKSGARLGVGVGAFFDFQAGVVERAPDWMNRAGLEWLYRLFKEPGRMWRRYIVGNPLFVLRVARQRVAGMRR
jgi:exopolysaccharide biosynthesis WecB/TagA/CpsF family protein